LSISFLHKGEKTKKKEKRKGKSRALCGDDLFQAKIFRKRKRKKRGKSISSNTAINRKREKRGGKEGKKKEVPVARRVLGLQTLAPIKKKKKRIKLRDETRGYSMSLKGKKKKKDGKEKGMAPAGESGGLPNPPPKRGKKKKEREKGERSGRSRCSRLCPLPLLHLEGRKENKYRRMAQVEN